MQSNHPVSLPVPNPTISAWQDPPSTISSFNSTPTLPSQVDTLIIGSGITGAAIAWNLLQQPNHGSIAMLEARGACSGATGRNGGHTKAASYRSFPPNITKFGLEEAKKIARLELANIKATHAFAKKHGIECENRSCDTVDIIYDDAQWTQCGEAVTLIRETFVLESRAFLDGGVARYQLWSAEEAREKFLVDGEGVKGAVSYEAGTISGYKFVNGVLAMCVVRGLQLYTHTPVTALENGVVRTAKGDVRAKRIVVATNGYTAHLLPQFQGLIVPVRGQVTAQRPGSRMPENGLENTYSFVDDVGYEYMIPRPLSAPFPGDIVIGGGLYRAENNGEEEVGNTDDATVNGEISAYLGNCTKRYFGDHWGEDDGEGRLRREWTGIMGFSGDEVPFVGEVPGMEGVWVAAGFQGHGMVLCWESARALVGMMEGRGKEVEEWFPGCFGVTEERLRLLRDGISA